MLLKTNSLSSMYYRWFYGKTERELPPNLCPYFWKSVFAWLIAIPYAIFCLPVILMETFDKGYENGDHSTGARIGMSIFIYFALFVLFMLGVSVTLFFTTYPKDSFLGNMAFGGILIWIFGGIMGAYHGIKAIIELVKEKKREQRYKKVMSNGGTYFEYVPKENIIIAFIKAKYNKYCPKIEWVTEVKNEEDDN